MKIIQPAAQRAGIGKRIGWHTFRHSYSSLLVGIGENVKVVQELMRHASNGLRSMLLAGTKGCEAACPTSDSSDDLAREDSTIRCQRMRHSNAQQVNMGAKQELQATVVKLWLCSVVL
jgi:hypothetical protein